MLDSMKADFSATLDAARRFSPGRLFALFNLNSALKITFAFPGLIVDSPTSYGNLPPRGRLRRELVLKLHDHLVQEVLDRVHRALVEVRLAQGLEKQVTSANTQDPRP